MGGWTSWFLNVSHRDWSLTLEESSLSDHGPFTTQLRGWATIGKALKRIEDSSRKVMMSVDPLKEVMEAALSSPMSCVVGWSMHGSLKILVDSCASGLAN